MEKEVKAGWCIKSSRPGRSPSEKGDDSVSIQGLGRRTSRRTDRQGKMLSLDPVTVTGNLAKKWLTSLGHEQISILMHELSRAGRGERRRGRDITGDPTDVWEVPPGQV